MKFAVKYHEIEHPLANEVSVTVTTGEDVASLIFFSGRGRAVTAMVPEFMGYAVKYEPCFVYLQVPASEVRSFLTEFSKAGCDHNIDRDYYYRCPECDSPTGLSNRKRGEA